MIHCRTPPVAVRVLEVVGITSRVTRETGVACSKIIRVIIPQAIPRFIQDKVGSAAAGVIILQRMDAHMNHQIVIYCLCLNVLQIKLKLPVIIRGPLEIQSIVINNGIGSFMTCISLEFVAELAHQNAVSIATGDTILVPGPATPSLSVSHYTRKKETFVIENKLGSIQRTGKTLFHAYVRIVITILIFECVLSPCQSGIRAHKLES